MIKLHRSTLSSLLFLLAVHSIHAADEPEKVKIGASPAKAEEQRGLESGYWALEPNSNPAETTSVVTDDQPENRILRVAYKGGDADKSAIKKQTGLAAAETGNLSVSIFCGEDECPGVSFALVTGQDYNWQETPVTKLSKGWNKVALDLAAKTWKSKATEWKNEAALNGRDDVRAIALNIYNGKNSGTLYLDAFQIDHTGDSKEIDAQIQKLTDAAAREEASKALLKSGRVAIEPLNTFVESSKDKDASSQALKILERLGARPKTE